MALLRLNSTCISFGDKPILDKVDLAINPLERIALVGRNGTGKSTLLKIIANEMLTDSGEVTRKQGLKVVRLEQEVPTFLNDDIYSVVASGLSHIGEILAKYKNVSEAVDAGERLDELGKLQTQIDAVDGWQLGQRVSEILSRMQLDPNANVNALSGGMKRRVLLAKALVVDPDILLLDEPTNHLDVPAIEWLEEYLLTARVSLVFVTHDRSFLRKLATRIIELDRGALTDWPGNYETYLKGKQVALDTEKQQYALQDKKLAQEETWIRQGIKARRTRNEGRVRALKKLRQEHAQRREQMGKARMNSQVANNSGKIVFEATGVNHAFGETTIVKDFKVTILRGDKIGIIGPNGVGKSTLINLLLGKIHPHSGQIHVGTSLKIAYFDQLRTALNPELTAMENVGQGSDTVIINQKPRHIISYMQDFLFAPERARAPIHALSGGEKNRLLLAKMFVQPSNLLILDEPTNDLDVETLELLEEILMDYKGTVLLVSHDREFLDNIVTDTLVFEDSGRVKSYVGGYSDWLKHMQNQLPTTQSTLKPKKSLANKPISPTKKKLSYKLQRELDLLPKEIESLEKEQSDLLALMASPDFFRNASDEVKKITDALESKENILDTAYARWEELEALANQ